MESREVSRLSFWGVVLCVFWGICRFGYIYSML